LRKNDIIKHYIQTDTGHWRGIANKREKNF